MEKFDKENFFKKLIELDNLLKDCPIQDTIPIILSSEKYQEGRKNGWIDARGRLILDLKDVKVTER